MSRHFSPEFYCEAATRFAGAPAPVDASLRTFSGTPLTRHPASGMSRVLVPVSARPRGDLGFSLGILVRNAG